MSDTRNGLTFSAWQRKVDHWVSQHASGMGINDLQDWRWWDEWDSETDPVEAGKMFLEMVFDEMGFEDLVTWERIGGG